MRKATPSIEESITCPTQDGTLYEKSVRAKVGRSPRWHSRSPASVSLDLKVSDAAARVYAVMTLKMDGLVCSSGVRYLGRVLGRGKSTVARLIKELVAAGHLVALEGTSGQRAQYRVTSPAFPNSGYCKHCKAHSKELRPSSLCWPCDERRVTQEAKSA